MASISSELEETNPTPARVRRRARLPISETSRLAYERATARRAAIYTAILAILAEHGPLTDDAIFRAYLAAGRPRRSRQNVGTARCELADAGKVRDTGHKGLSEAGDPARLWDIGFRESSSKGAEGADL